jgi:pimeloyl-ACP methyl ester carboxylesterase
LKVLANLSLSLAKIIGYRNFYKLSARIMLPRNNHKKSRDVFINESKALSVNEFKKWTALYYNLNKTLLEFFNAKSSIPHLLIMGSQDHLFLEPAKDYAIYHSNATIKVIQDCGHVVSIEKAKKFNSICLNFLKSLS